MASLRILLSKLTGVFRKAKLEQQLDEDVRAHLEMLTEENLRRGMDTEEARFAALRQFGNVSSMKEECRETWGIRLIEELIQDVRYGLRQLRQNPGFTVVAVLTLALGIGANTAIFSVVNAVILRPLPIYQPGRVVTIHDHYAITGLQSISVSAPQFDTLSRLKDIFAHTAVVTRANFDLQLSGQPERVKGLLVSAGFFPLLGVKPRLGQWLLPSEDRQGANHVVVISAGLWERAFASSPNVIGRRIMLNNEDYTVAGVMPASFSIPQLNADLWAPLALTPAQLDPSQQIDHQWLYMIARLQQGVTLSGAQAALDNATAQFRREYPNRFPPRVGFGIRAVPFTADLVGGTSGYLFLLLAAVGFILLIACANLANLTLSRTSARSREMALRTALGASRPRVFRQLLTESVLLSLAGGGVGLCLALAGLAGVKAIDGGNIPRLDQAGIGAHVLLFTAAISLVTGALFGLAPAIRASRTGLSESLKEGGRSGSETGGHQRIRNLLVVSEVSLTLVLLAGTLLMTKSFARLLDVNPGFDPHNVLTLRIALPSPRYSSNTRVVTFYQSLMQRVRRLPRVEAAGAVSQLPFNGFVASGSFRIEDRPMGPGVVLPHANIRQITPGFMRALRVPLRMGRTFTEADNATAPQVAIVDTTLVRLYWPGENPIGQRVLFPLGSGGTWRTVVGVVGNVRYGGFSAPRKGVLYLPQAQSPQQDLSLVIRTAAAPAAIANEVRRAVSDVDSQQPIYSVKTMRQYISESVTDRSLDVFLLSVLGGLALVLASVGIYGVISYDVSRRRREIGIRLALGAVRGDMLKMVVWKGVRLALIGVAIGVAGALALTRFLSSLLYGVKPTDPLTFIAVSLILIAVALLASYVPARRAAKVDPLVALRYE